MAPHVSQFGWQFEKQFYTKGSGVTMVTEWVALLGGLEQSVALPSLSWMVGVRTRDGAEFGIGPNITPAGTALVLATGMTFRAGAMNVPVNVAVVPSKSGDACQRSFGLQPSAPLAAFARIIRLPEDGRLICRAEGPAADDLEAPDSRWAEGRVRDVDRRGRDRGGSHL